MRYLEPNAYAEESKRHNRVLEELAKAKEKWYENQVEQKNKIQQLRQELSEVNADINNTNKVLDKLRQVTSIKYQGKTCSREPQLSNF